MTYAGVPDHLVGLFTALGSPWFVFVAMILFLLILGFFLETASIIIVFSPLLAHVALAVGFDPIWFASIFVIMLETALITPPVGFNLFVLKGIAPEISTGDIYRGVFPFVVMNILLLVLLCFFPQIALFLVQISGL